MNEEEKGKVIKCLDNGEWVDTKEVEQALGIDFKEGLKLFDFSRTAEWWSIVGETDEERAYEGQKITTKFRYKKNSKPILSASGKPIKDVDLITFSR